MTTTSCFSTLRSEQWNWHGCDLTQQLRDKFLTECASNNATSTKTISLEQAEDSIRVKTTATGNISSTQMQWRPFVRIHSVRACYQVSKAYQHQRASPFAWEHVCLEAAKETTFAAPLQEAHLLLNRNILLADVSQTTPHPMWFDLCLLCFPEQLTCIVRHNLPKTVYCPCFSWKAVHVHSLRLDWFLTVAADILMYATNVHSSHRILYLQPHTVCLLEFCVRAA